MGGQKRPPDIRGRRGGRRVQRKKEKNIVGQGVFNLSSKTLTNDELFLDKGLKYATPQKKKIGQVPHFY